MKHFDKQTLIGAVTGDVHLAHHRVNTDKIISVLETLFLNTIRNKRVNFICINGDLYDRLTADTDIDKLKSKRFFVSLMLYCQKNNIVLRLLKGTPSHDHDQLKEFEAIAKAINGLDFKYIDKVYVEKNERFDSSILYIPDEWKHNCSETYIDCVNAIKEQGLKSVDYCFVHGQFDYQLGDIVADRLKHKVSDFEKIVNKKVFCNHIHMYSENSIVIAPGSIERLSQTEQSDKGFIVFTDTQDGCDCEFIVNEKATGHYTINCSNIASDEVLDYVHKKMQQLKPVQDDIIRIRCTSDSAVKSMIGELSKIYNQFTLYLDTKTVKLDRSKVIKKPIGHAMTINAQTVGDLLKKQMLSNGVDIGIVEDACKLLTVVI